MDNVIKLEKKQNLSDIINQITTFLEKYPYDLSNHFLAYDDDWTKFDRYLDGDLFLNYKELRELVELLHESINDHIKFRSNYNETINDYLI